MSNGVDDIRALYDLLDERGMIVNVFIHEPDGRTYIQKKLNHYGKKVLEIITDKYEV